MLAFAWVDTGLLEITDMGSIAFEKPWDVAAHLLDNAIKRVMRYGLASRFVDVEDNGRRVEGRLDLSRTMRERLLMQGKVAFVREDLSVDIPANQLIKAAVRKLFANPLVSLGMKDILRAHLATLSVVSDVAVSALLRRPLASVRYDAGYVEMMWLVRLVLEDEIPNPNGRDFQKGGVLLGAAMRSRMPKLFEGFVRGAARCILVGQADQVKSGDLHWDLKGSSAIGSALVPKMQADVLIHWKKDLSSLVECKYYLSPWQVHRKSGGKKLRSGHLYQLMCYTYAMQESGRSCLSSTLLYAASGERLDEKMLMNGHALRVFFLNLDTPWPGTKRAAGGHCYLERLPPKGQQWGAGFVQCLAVKPAVSEINPFLAIFGSEGVPKPMGDGLQWPISTGVTTTARIALLRSQVGHVAVRHIDETSLQTRRASNCKTMVVCSGNFAQFCPIMRPMKIRSLLRQPTAVPSSPLRQGLSPASSGARPARRACAPIRASRHEQTVFETVRRELGRQVMNAESTGQVAWASKLRIAIGKYLRMEEALDGQRTSQAQVRLALSSVLELADTGSQPEGARASGHAATPTMWQVLRVACTLRGDELEQTRTAFVPPRLMSPYVAPSSWSFFARYLDGMLHKAWPPVARSWLDALIPAVDAYLAHEERFARHAPTALSVADLQAAADDLWSKIDPPPYVEVRDVPLRVQLNGETKPAKEFYRYDRPLSDFLDAAAK